MLTLCLIARDEQDLLPGCLASVQDLVDEIVVADTGSTDRTVELALAAGAVVVDHPWQEDFAAARNAALAAASGDWVLVLDADERVVDGSAIRQAIARDDLDLGLVRLHNADSLQACWPAVLSGEARRGEAIWLPRLFRRTPDLRWEGVVHELPRRWIEAGRRVRRVEVDLIHLGNVPSVREGRNKRERNLRLLEKRCAAEPDRSTPWGYLASERVHAGDLEGAREAAERGWEALHAELSRGERPTFVSLTTVRCHLQLRAQHPEEALETLRQAAAWGADHPNLPMLRGNALEMSGRLEDAMAAYEEANAWTGDAAEEVLPGATSWASLLRMAELGLVLGKPSRRSWEEVLRLGRDTLEVRLGLAESLLHEGHPRECIAALEGVLSRDTPDAWCLAALACGRIGRPDEVVQFSRRAASAALRQGFVSVRRRRLLEEARAEAALYEGRLPVGATVAGRMAALIRRVPLDAPPIDGAGAVTIALNLVRLGRTQLLEGLLEPRSEDLLEGLKEGLTTALTSQGAHIEDDGEPDFVFIGGAGRSGTTLFRSMLSAHPRFWCGPELKLVSAICGLRQQWMSTMGPDLAEAGVTPKVLDRAVRAFVQSLLTDTGEGERIAEKTPHNLLHMELLGRLFPRARFIHVVRDGRAVSASLVKQAWRDPSTGGPIWYCADLTSASRYWAQVVGSIRNQSVAVPGRFLEVRYEDLVSAPRATMMRVTAFLGERWEESVLSHEQAGVKHSRLESSTGAARRALGTDAVDRWRRELDDEALTGLDPQARTLLSVLGYAA